MYKIAVSPEHLEALGYSVEKFKDCISREYEHLQNQTKAFRAGVDDVTGSAVAQSVQAIGGIIADDVESLNNVTKSVHAYADKLRIILHKVESHKNSPKEVLAAAVGAAACDVGTVRDCVQLADAALEGIELATGQSFKPPTEPILGVLDALADSGGLQDYSGTPIPQEQIDSHTLVVDDTNELWNKK